MDTPKKNRGRVGKEMLADGFPDLAAEVVDMDPATLSINSNRRPTWRCAEGHEWQALVANRTRRGSGCPYCSGLRKIPGVNDLAALHPEIAATFSAANDRTLAGISPNDNRKYLWACPEGHDYSAPASSRVRGRGCPYCSGQKVLPGFNDLATAYPEIAAMWSGEGLSPAEVTPRSRKRIELRCGEGHTFEIEPMSFTRRPEARCPVCTGRRLVPGVNDLATVRPGVAAMWDGTGVSPAEVTAGSSQKLNFRCAKGHRWTTYVHTVAREDGTGCPTCAGNRVDKGRTDLAATRPYLAAQWHPDNDRGPDEVSEGSGYVARWLCESGHEWEAAVYNRAGNDSGCRRCWSGSRTSVGEGEVAAYIADLIPGAVIERHVYGVIQGELDIYLPEHRTAVEYNGVYWHSEARKSRNYHRDKVRACRNRGVRLIQVWEDDWTIRRPAVKNMLAAKLGASTLPRIGARQCSVDTEVQVVEANSLLTEHHVQGPVRATYRYGLRSVDGTLAAVLCLRKVGTDLYLDRYATAARVPGGFTRLLSEVRRRHVGMRLVTFSDNEISEGDLYDAAGFTRDVELRPDYTYLVGGERRHKFGYRKARFKSDPMLKFKEGLTEKELASLNKIPRVWDSGKVRWLMHL